MKEEKANITRRQFVGAVGAILAGGAVASIAGAETPPKKGKGTGAPVTWHEKADVVVVGYGGAGACAAIEAASAGASVLILEKDAMPGGTTVLSGGTVYAANTSVQKKKGVEDTAEEMFKYIKACGQGVADDDLVRVAAERSGENIDWLQSLGVEFPTDLLVVSGMEKEPEYSAITPPKPRGHRCKGTGTAFFGALKKGVEAKKAKVMLKTRLVRPITKNIGPARYEVLGVKAEKDGKEINILARKAVILTTGGCIVSDESKGWLQDYSPDIALCVPAGNLNSSGDGYRAGIACGAALKGMNKGGLLPCVFLPGSKMAGAVYLNIWGLPNIYVGPDGKRFVNESAYYVLVCEDMIRKGLPSAYCVFDSETIKKGFEMVPKGIEATRTLAFGIDPNKMDQGVEKGFIWRGMTPGELAKNMKIDTAGLESTLETYNNNAKSGKDPDFARGKGLAPVASPPFYAFKIHVGMVCHDGGLKINIKSQVINTYGEVIPRLYAAGRDACGLFGGRYPGSGGALSDLVAFGRIAGKNAAAEKPQKS